MSVLLGPDGAPISSSQFARPKKDKAPIPVVGREFAQWAGREPSFSMLPGQGLLQFDLERLTLADYRNMTSHYQVNSSLSVLSFMLHQSNWQIVHPDKKVRDFMTENLEEIWTQLNRSLSQAHWAGYSPNALSWENVGRRVVLTKIKDLYPEDCDVNWKDVDGYAPPAENGYASIPPKIKVYDGIKQWGWPRPIPVGNSFWFPLLMENGNYYGKKLLKSSFTSYFFSLLMHMYAGRYYERFGEPTPIGRAPQDDYITDVDGKTQTSSREYMFKQIMQLRNHSVVVLPSDKSGDPSGNNSHFDYDLEYLESQMRGADFERHMSRLDEEITLGLFTPVLLFKTSDVGSYNLGTGHMQMYLWMLNALNADRKQYIDKYLLRPMMLLNFGDKTEMPKIKFQKMDRTNAEMVNTIIQALIGKDRVKPDVQELGQMAGLTLEEIDQTRVTPQPAPNSETDDPNNENTETESGNNPAKDGTFGLSSIRADIVQRVSGQAKNAFNRGAFDERFKLYMGNKKRIESFLTSQGVPSNVARDRTDAMFSRMDVWSSDLASVGLELTRSADDFVRAFEVALDAEMAELD